MWLSFLNGVHLKIRHGQNVLKTQVVVSSQSWKDRVSMLVTCLNFLDIILVFEVAVTLQYQTVVLSRFSEMHRWFISGFIAPDQTEYALGATDSVDLGNLCCPYIKHYSWVLLHDSRTSIVYINSHAQHTHKHPHTHIYKLPFHSLTHSNPLTLIHTHTLKHTHTHSHTHRN